MLQRLSRHSSRLGFAFAALILVAIGAWVVFGVQRFAADATWVEHTHEVLTQIENFDGLRREVTSAQRGYLLTRRLHDRDNYWQARAKVRAELDRLGQLVADNRAQRAATARLQPLLERRLEVSASTVSEFESHGLDAARAFILGNGSVAIDANIDAEVARMQVRERALLVERDRNSRRSASSLLLGAALGIPLSLGILGSIYLMLIRENAQRRRSEAQAGMASLELGRSVAQL
jgi:CHASE3 domain sensor protein